MSAKSANGMALITGASAGIGATYADRLARRGALGPNLSKNHAAERYGVARA
jgi:NADP-dependent 3-hydroxy acid dehydrogenase YdfG